MQNKKRIILIVIIVMLSMIILIAGMSYLSKKNSIQTIYETYDSKNVQNRLVNEQNDEIIEKSITNNSIDNIIEKRNNENVIGIIKIDKINYEGLIYEGTSLDILSKGVGHFENSAYFEGNVCLANHNTIGQWSKLYTLKINDLIEYTSFLGKKTYKVITIKEIEETSWDMLKQTEDNKITLITCVKGKPSKRLCVQGIEVN